MARIARIVMGVLMAVVCTSAVQAQVDITLGIVDRDGPPLKAGNLCDATARISVPPDSTWMGGMLPGTLEWRFNPHFTVLAMEGPGWAPGENYTVDNQVCATGYVELDLPAYFEWCSNVVTVEVLGEKVWQPLGVPIEPPFMYDSHGWLVLPYELIPVGEFREWHGVFEWKAGS